MSYRIHCYLTKFPHVGIEKYNTNNRILLYKIFPTKNVANGGTLKYFQQKMLQKYRRPNQQKFGKSNRQKWGQIKIFPIKNVQMGIQQKKEVEIQYKLHLKNTI